MTKTECLKILWYMPIAGPLYRVQAEDGELYCYDWTIHAATPDGRTFEHATHVVQGALKNSSDFWVANYNHRNKAKTFCQRVDNRGSINLAHWVETTGASFDLETVLKEEAGRERLERGGQY